MIRGRGHEVAAIARTGLEAIRAYRRQKPDVVFLDFAMEGLNGLTACRNILSGDHDACIYLISGFAEPQLLAASASGARAVLQKPLLWPVIARALEEAAAYRSLFRTISITASAA